MSERKVKIQFVLPEDLRTRFRAWCVLNNLTLSEALIRLIEQELDQKGGETLGKNKESK